MPIPRPRQNEKRKDFIQRCMTDSVMVKEYGNKDQRLAVCSFQYRKSIEK